MKKGELFVNGEFLRRRIKKVYEERATFLFSKYCLKLVMFKRYIDLERKRRRKSSLEGRERRY